jgi:hypothetical protein
MITRFISGDHTGKVSTGGSVVTGIVIHGNVVGTPEKTVKTTFIFHICLFQE